MLASSRRLLRLASSSRFSSGALPSNTNLHMQAGQGGGGEVVHSWGECAGPARPAGIWANAGAANWILTQASSPPPACALCGRTCPAGGCGAVMGATDAASKASRVPGGRQEGRHPPGQRGCAVGSLPGHLARLTRQHLVALAAHHYLHPVTAVLGWLQCVQSPVRAGKRQHPITAPGRRRCAWMRPPQSCVQSSFQTSAPSCTLGQHHPAAW